MPSTTLAASAILSIFFASLMVAQEVARTSGVFLLPLTRSEKSPGPGLHEVVTAWSKQFVSLGPPLAVKSVEIHSTNNANSMYNALVSPCHWAVLNLDGTLIGSNGSGGGETCRSSFLLTRDQARRVESFFGVNRQDRHEIGKQLLATFSVSPKFELVVRIVNPRGAPAVQWVQGWGQQGDRNNQFAMRIRRDGKPVAEIPITPRLFVGPIGAQLLRPGEAVELSAPISSWGDISRPGRYVVQGAFHTDLAYIDAEAFGGLGRADRWDRRFEGTVIFVIPCNGHALYVFTLPCAPPLKPI